MGPPCHCLKSFFPAGQQFWGEIAPKMPYAHLYFKTTAGKKQTEESRTGFNGFRAEVKRLLPEWDTSTGSKFYMRIQFVLYGNKSYTSV